MTQCDLDCGTAERLLFALDDEDRLRRLSASCDWERLDRLVRQQGLTGRLAAGLRAADLEGAIPTKLWSSWQARARETAAGFDAACAQLDPLIAALDERGISACLLKGPTLVLAGLQRPEERRFGDLDLLVPAERLQDVATVMGGLGYVQRTNRQRTQWARMSHYHDPRWYHRDHSLPVEVHWHLLRPDHPLAFDTGSLRTVAVQLPSGQTLKRFDDADLLAHLCLHFWGDRAAGQPRAIGQLWDIADVSDHLDSDAWEAFWSRAASRGQTRVVAAVLGSVALLLQRHDLKGLERVNEATADPHLQVFARTRICRQRPAHVQLFAPYDDVHFGAGRHLRQRLSWLYSPRSPMRWWPAVALTRLASALLRSQSELARIYGVEPSLGLRIAYSSELGRLVARALLRPGRTVAELRIDRWAQNITMSADRPRG